MQNTLITKVAISRATTLFSYFGLLLFLSAWYLLIAPPKTANPYVIWAFQCLPLALFYPVIIKKHLRGHIWLCFMLTVYFMHAVTIAMSSHSNATLALIEALLVSALFTGAMMFARWQSKLSKLQNNPEANS
ncbi:DUF2069 domain-containing protein [Amphritea balenae]|uniref:DUF2069 domain-containing protein n=1 Tax=Amphritea balenae TaxID=452629 RepID=A0A3P1STQ9_9GAMM|nr:DUF2069 domain-containing protein [Amphritea balenae]RRD00594.1 DUF2069 domain-containing protein [Amphritea balenae]GGK69504.1 hypothetical protein GCM10007941_19590 [Amphritea balenae]